ncbi:MAG: DUF460 domain-containing protein [Nanopusillaceae archaeon]
MKALIAGIDPGTNTGIVVIDEDGNIIDKFSGKNISNEEIIRYISDLNNVVLIATDKREIPKGILEISSKLNIGVYYPKKDIDLETKNKYYTNNKLKDIFENNHEFDAYISAFEALKKVKDIIEKARKVSKDENEYIRILKIIFKNRKIEPVSAKNNLEKESKIENNKNKKRKNIKRKRNIENIRIIIEKKIEKEENKIKELNEKYIGLLNDYNKISILLLNKLNEKDTIIPKASFLYSNKLYYKKIFLDKVDEEYIRYFINKNTEFFILEKDKDKVKEFLKEYYIVTDFIDIKNFIVVNNYKKWINEENKEEDLTVEKLKKILKEYRTHLGQFRK